MKDILKKGHSDVYIKKEGLVILTVNIQLVLMQLVFHALNVIGIVMG